MADQQHESEDELDVLLQHYERQAAADVAAVQQQQGGGARKKQKLSAVEQREEALSQPIAADNKCACNFTLVGWCFGYSTVFSLLSPCAI